MKTSPFKRTHLIEDQIDEYLDKLSEAGMLFETGFCRYVTHGADENVEITFDQLSIAESRADELRREIERVLYAEMLLPEARSDVLTLLDELDDVVDELKHSLQGFLIEHPVFPEDTHEVLRELAGVVAQCVEELSIASRTYFRDPNAVRDRLHKVNFHESEADRIAIRVSRHVFDSDLPLEQKRHLRAGIMSVDHIADEAQDVADRLAIFAVKRRL